MQSDRLRWREVRATTPFRLTLMLGGVFLIGVWATVAIGYFFTAHELTTRSDQLLFVRAKSLLAEPPATLPARIDGEIANAAQGFTYFALLGREGQFVTGNIRLSGPYPEGTAFNLPAREGRHGPLRILVVRTPGRERIVLGRDIAPIADLRSRLLQILLVSGVAGTAMILAAAVILSQRPLRRVRDLERASRTIAAGALTHRMPIAGRNDELDQFAATVNLMLDEVAHVVAQVKTATDAIAHDLRTPLTRVRTALHRMFQREDLSPAARAIIQGAVQDLDAVVERFAALLRVSELEAGGRRAGMSALHLAPVLRDLADLYEPLAEERGITLVSAIACDPVVHADRELLSEAIGNLIDNAIKFARARVMLLLRIEAGEAVIEVVDDGPGIPPDEREAVLRRFHRASGAAGVEGTGLGLAVVSAILHLHGFALVLDDVGPGLVARIRTAPSAR